VASLTADGGPARSSNTSDVAGRAHSYPEMLSGGEQQRVAIARALANEPSLILADEPTAALDSVRSRAVMELFRKVAHDRGAAVLVVTHDHRALDVFDVLYEMEDGGIRAHREQRSLAATPELAPARAPA
jgi:putative ABC transport system ATP-binding protein